MKINYSTLWRFEGLIFGSYFILSFIVFFAELYYRLNDLENQIPKIFTFFTRWYMLALILFFISSILLLYFNHKYHIQYVKKLIQANENYHQKMIKEVESIVWKNTPDSKININYTVEEIKPDTNENT